jgi:hypothetical protein
VPALQRLAQRITKFPLEDAAKVLDLMHTGKLRNRGVLVIA